MTRSLADSAASPRRTTLGLLACSLLVTAVGCRTQSGCHVTAYEGCAAPLSTVTHHTDHASDVPEPESVWDRDEPEDRPDLPMPEPESDDPETDTEGDAAPSDDAKQSAVERVELLGGRCTRETDGRLVEVDLSGTEATDDDLVALHGSHHLVALDLGGTRVSNAGLRALPRLRSLRILDLSESRVTGNGLSALSRHPRLEFLVLSGTKIGEPGIDALSELKTLRGLDVEATDLKPQHLDRLRAALPNCRVHGTESGGGNDELSLRLRDEGVAMALADQLAASEDWDGVVVALRAAAAQPGASREIRRRLAAAFGRIGNLPAAQRLYEETDGPARARLEIAMLEYEAAVRRARRRATVELGTVRHLSDARRCLTRFEQMDGRSSTFVGVSNERLSRTVSAGDEHPTVNMAIAHPETLAETDDVLTIQPRGISAKAREVIVSPPARLLPTPPREHGFAGDPGIADPRAPTVERIEHEDTGRTSIFDPMVREIALRRRMTAPVVEPRWDD